VKRSIFTRRRIALGTAAVVVVGLAGATTAYATYFSGRGLPGVTVAGTSVTGQTAEQAAAALSQRAADVGIDVTLDGRTTTFTLADLGAVVDAEATIANAFEANGQLGSRLSALTAGRDVPIVVSFDDSRAQQVVDGLVGDASAPARDATVSVAADGASFAVTPAQAGISVDAGPLIEAATAAAATLTSTDVVLSPTSVEPLVSTEKAQKVADAANGLVSLDVAVDGRGEIHAASATEKVGWVALPALDTADPQPAVDGARVGAWIASVGEATEIAPVAGVRNVNERGEVVSISQEGQTGYAATNTDAVTSEAVAALQAGVPYSGALSYDATEPTYEDRLIAEGAQNLVYQAAPGEKWLDVDLSSNSVTAYEGATVVSGPMAMVPGMPEMPTPTGTFRVYLKYDVQTMRGTNPDGTPYVAPGIPWVTYFTGSIAFHGAPWRDSFGWSGPGGSHGCVNLPVSSAKFIYDWAPMGTVVVSHY